MIATTFDSFNVTILPGIYMFADWLKQKRLDMGLNQTELGVLCGLHRSVISKLEKGTRPTPETLKSLAKGMKIPREEMYRAAGILADVSRESAQTEKLLYYFGLLNEFDKQHILDLANFLASKNG